MRMFMREVKPKMKLTKRLSSTRIYWTLKTPYQYTEDGLKRIQRENGYHELGYGFGGFKKLLDGSGYEWYCFSSCD